MTQISASDVNQLRKATGAGMMDCKKALTVTEGDFQKATDLLRKKGQKIAEKREGRDRPQNSRIQSNTVQIDHMNWIRYILSVSEIDLPATRQIAHL